MVACSCRAIGTRDFFNVTAAMMHRRPIRQQINESYTFYVVKTITWVDYKWSTSNDPVIDGFRYGLWPVGFDIFYRKARPPHIYIYALNNAESNLRFFTSRSFSTFGVRIICDVFMYLFLRWRESGTVCLYVN